MYLKRLEIQGFKTFAGRVVVEFPAGVTAVVGPNGSGKCVRGETLVALASGRELPIKELVDSALRQALCPEILDDGWATRENPDQIIILSLNPQTLRLEPRPVAGFIKRTAPPTLLKIRTSSGREVTATPYHPLFTLEDGRLKALKASELRLGLGIAVPKYLSLQGRAVGANDDTFAAARHALGEAASAGPEQATPDIVLDEIVHVEEVAPSDPWVYDLCIAETHNFVAGNIVVHNSNLGDALSWVLGEQSQSALRSRKTEDLIFSGGTRRAPVGMAEVTLTIDNADGVLPVPFSEVTITRRAYRSGENEYFLNRSRVRLKDIHEATASLSQSYTIVNQGLVDAVLSLRPEERRGLFEDAAETSVAATRKDEAERRLKEAEANLARLGDLLGELEPRVRVLRRQARDAEQAQQVQEEIDVLLRRHHLRLWREANAALEAAQGESEAAARELALRKQRLDLCLSELRSVRAELHEQRQSLDALDASLRSLQTEAQALDRELAVVSERREALGRQQAEALAALAALEQQLGETSATREAALARVAELEQALQSARAGLAALEQTHQSARRQRQTFEQALEAAREQAFEAESAVTAQRNRIAELARRRVELQAELQTQAREQAAAQQREAAARKTLAEAEAALEHATAAHVAARTTEEQAGAGLEQIREERARLETEVAAARREADQLHSQLEALERTQRSYAGNFAGVRAAMLWAQKSGRQDFALVSAVLRVPAELETALETALGSRLQQIVVERWQDAEEAIAELKRSGAGRATFMPLDSLRPHRPGKAPKAPGIVGVADELVEYDGRYERAVRQLLGRTLVAQDLQAARRALEQLEGGWTIVTLAGEQVASGGSLTGGAAVKESGTLRRERELRELPGRLQAARAELERLEEVTRQAAVTEQERLAARREAERAQREARQEEERRREAVSSQRRAVERAAQELGWHVARQGGTQRELGALEEREQEARRALTQAEVAAEQMSGAIAQAKAELEAQVAAGRAAEEELLRARSGLSELEAQLRGQRREAELQATMLREYEARQRESGERRQLFAGEQRRLEEQESRAAGRRMILEEQLQQLLGSRQALFDSMASVESRILTLQEQEQALAAATLQGESAYGRANAGLEGARVRRDQVWERCAEEGLDIEALAAAALDEDGAAEGGEPVQERLEQLRARLRRMGEINPLAPAEYQQTVERQDFLTAQLSDARAAANSLREVIAELEATMRARFAETFEAVAAEFSQTFARLFGGGSAQLQILESEAGPQGIEIVAQAPGKRRQPLSLLSGGERALTSAALLFALLRVRPVPFCVLDEVDAALDESNVARFRELLVELSRETQFIVVTHNRGTVEAASTIYGVSMGPDGASRMISMRLEDLQLEDAAQSA